MIDQVEIEVNVSHALLSSVEIEMKSKKKIDKHIEITSTCAPI